MIARLRLSRAKHRSLQGHARLARWLARQAPFYEFGGDEFFCSDGAPETIAGARRAGFERLAKLLQERGPATIEATEALAPDVSDLQFTAAYRVPFQYRSYVNRHLKIGSLLRAANGVSVSDLDGNESYDVAGSYGLNLF